VRYSGIGFGVFFPKRPSFCPPGPSIGVVFTEAGLMMCGAAWNEDSGNRGVGGDEPLRATINVFA